MYTYLHLCIYIYHIHTYIYIYVHIHEYISTYILCPPYTGDSKTLEKRPSKVSKETYLAPLTPATQDHCLEELPARLVFSIQEIHHGLPRTLRSAIVSEGPLETYVYLHVYTYITYITYIHTYINIHTCTNIQIHIRMSVYLSTLDSLSRERESEGERVGGKNMSIPFSIF